MKYYRNNKTVSYIFFSFLWKEKFVATNHDRGLPHMFHILNLRSSYEPGQRRWPLNALGGLLGFSVFTPASPEIEISPTDSLRKMTRQFRIVSFRSSASNCQLSIRRGASERVVNGVWSIIWGVSI